MGETSVLIVPSPEGKKYSFAIKWGVPCVYPEWLYKSVQQGHALEEEEYEVQMRKTSTLANSHIDNGKCIKMKYFRWYAVIFFVLICYYSFLLVAGWAV